VKYAPCGTRRTSTSAGGMYATLCGEPPNKRILRIHSGEMLTIFWS
jgi:hypothetical protein